MIVDYMKCQVTHPDGVIHKARFVFINGKAAVWTEDKRTRSAKRILYAEGATFTKAKTARFAHELSLSTGETWQILQNSGGCGCGSIMKSYSANDLTDINRSTIP